MTDRDPSNPGPLTTANPNPHVDTTKTVYDHTDTMGIRLAPSH